MTEPSAVAGAGKILASTPLSTWKEWLAFRFISRPCAVSCPRRSTTRASPSTRRRCTAFRSSATAGSAASPLVNGALGEGVGQIYVQRHYPPETDRQMQRADRRILAAPTGQDRAQRWMDEPTSKAALDKLARFDPRIGHPVKYIDYSSMQVGTRRPARQRDPRPSSSTGTCSSRASPSPSTARCGT